MRMELKRDEVIIRVVREVIEEFLLILRVKFTGKFVKNLFEF